MLDKILPLGVLSDSYKAAHFCLYPPCSEISAYAEFRQSFDKDTEDDRILFFGIRYIIENYVAKRWTIEDVDRAALFFSTHNAGYSPFPFPKELFLKFIREHDGYFPVIIESLPEGQTVYPHVPVYQITAHGEYAPLCTWLETILTMVWYPTTVCTLSRRAKVVINDAFTRSVDKDGMFLLQSRLHDFGFRGCTSVEQSVIGGISHLVNFDGTDTMSAAFYAQFHLNGGKPVATSIPATEHSIMTAWKTEKEAMLNLIEKYGSGLYACVMDSYNYEDALNSLLPSISKLKTEKGGFIVLRPDSGDPVETVLMALRAGEKVFGSVVNLKGYKVLNGCSVIQGDGVNLEMIKRILAATLEIGFSAQNVAFGMGGGLLQKVHRDTMSFATKVCSITYDDGEIYDIMKMPKTDLAKFSLPGKTRVCLNHQNLPIVYPQDKKQGTSLMEVVYDHGKVKSWDSFDVIRKRAEETWINSPCKLDPISKELHEKIQHTIGKQRRQEN